MRITLHAAKPQLLSLRSLLLLTFTFYLLPVTSCLAGELTDKVNPFVGTTTLWNPKDLGYTRTEAKRAWGAEAFPGAALPNAMVQCTPVTMYHTGSGYQYEDHQIYGFAHTCKGHWNLLHVPLLPVTTEGKWRPDNYCSWFSHDNESAHPGYYQVFLQRYNVNAELTTTLRCAYHKYTFRPGDDKKLLVDISHSNAHPRHYEVRQAGPRAFEGYQDGEGRAYFYAVVNYDISRVDILREFHDPVGIVSFLDSRNPQPLEVRIGFSFVSIENARQNLQAELLQSDLTFQQVRAQADQSWEQLLSHIQVDGGTAKQQAMLYSTLYKTFLYPNLRSDVNGEYLDERGQVVHADFRYYNTPSFWDTYRNKLILLGMVAPDVAADIISSCIDRGEKRGGYMPSFFHGDHASAFVAGSWLRGIHGFDLGRAYRLMLKNATVPGQGGREFLDEYNRQGWIAEKDTFNVPTWNENGTKASVTKTVEYAYDDYATALVARQLKDKHHERMLMQRAQNYRNLFDPATGFWRGRLADGSWIEDFRPDYPYYRYMYREADAWNSLLFAPHDPYGVARLYPSPEALELKLDSLFSQPNGGYEAWNLTGYLGLYCHGNQPGHSLPFAYYFVGRQEKSQQVLCRLLNDYYGMGEERLAYAGMDDAGEMSAWYVLTAIGIYTYSPADPEYLVSVPLFDRVSFSLTTTGKTFTISRQGNGMKIKQILVGGKPLKGWFVSHADLEQGKQLKIITE